MRVLLQAPEFAAKYKGAALVSLVATSGSTPRHAGTFMLVSDTGEQLGTIGGGRVELELVGTARQVAQGGGVTLSRHHLVRDLGMCCGGSMTFLTQPLGDCLPHLELLCGRRSQRLSSTIGIDLSTGEMHIWADPPEPSLKKTLGSEFRLFVAPEPRLLLFGAGHLARAIGPLGASLGFEVVLCDDNETAAIDVEPLWARHVVPSFILRDVERFLGSLGAADYLLILTRDHSIDQDILEACLPRVQSLAYLGLIGSSGKIARFRKRIGAKGLASEVDWARLHGPMGIDIGAETPMEIAVSILAQLIEVKNRSELRGR